MTPTPTQAAAIAAILAWWNDPYGAQVFRLFGYAGTGKSTIFKLVREALAGGRRPLNRFALATFTGMAASVLRRKGNAEAKTLHSLIYIPDDTVKVPVCGAGAGWRLNWDGEAAEVDLIVLDEVSMVDAPMGADVLGFGKRVLVMGDPGQLPPIGGEGFFTAAEPDVMLTEVHRQAKDSPIIMLATMAREGKLLTPGTWTGPDGSTARVLVHGRETQAELYREETQPLAGLHRVRMGYNLRIRRLRGFEGERPCQGEPLIVRKNSKKEGIFNGTSATLLTNPRPYKRRPGDDEGDSNLMVMDIKAEEVRQDLRNLKVDPYLFDRHFREVEEPRWRGGIHWLDWGYVRSVHGAQGSEWPDVTLVDDSGAFRENRHRHAYTGATRASEHLTVLVRR